MSKGEKVGDEDRNGEEALNTLGYGRGYRGPAQVGKAFPGGQLQTLLHMPVASCFSLLMDAS